MQIALKGPEGASRLSVEPPTWGRLNKSLEELSESQGMGECLSVKKEDDFIELSFEAFTLRVESSPGELRSASLFDQVEDWAKSSHKERPSRSGAKRRQNIKPTSSPSPAQVKSSKKQTGRMNASADFDLGRELLEAVKDRDSSRVAELLAEGASPAFYFSAPLRWATYGNEYEMASVLLEAGASPWESSDVMTWDLLVGDSLCIAIREGHMEIAALLIKANPDKMKRNTSYYMRQAIHSGQIDRVQFLLDAGCNPNGDDEFQPPLGDAAFKGRLDIMDLLLGRGAVADIRSLYYAIIAGRLPAVEHLVKAGANPWLDEARTIGEADHRGLQEISAFLRLQPGRPSWMVRGFKQLFGTKQD